VSDKKGRKSMEVCASAHSNSAPDRNPNLTNCTHKKDCECIMLSFLLHSVLVWQVRILCRMLLWELGLSPSSSEDGVSSSITAVLLWHQCWYSYRYSLAMMMPSDASSRILLSSKGYLLKGKCILRCHVSSGRKLLDCILDDLVCLSLHCQFDLGVAGDRTT